MNRTISRTLRAACLAGVAMTAFQARAQDAADQTTVEEIVVTARRTSENVQQVPLTVNVVTAQRLENAGIVNTSQIRNLVSNLYWNDSGGGTTENSINIRGINSNASRQGFESGVGIYMDEVYISDTTGFNMALLDVDRIEVLKGPQGTLFGRNTTAGAISVHTRKPSTADQYTEVAGRIGNYDLYEVRGVTNFPLSDKMALKVSGIYRDRGGYQTNVVNGKRELNNEHFWGGRAQLLVTPTEDIDLLFTADYFKNDDLQNVQSCFGPPNCLFNPTQASIFDDRAADNNSFTERTLWSVALNAKWRIGDWELTSITAYQDRQYIDDQDQDYVGIDYLRSGYNEPDAWQFSQELRIATPRDNPIRGVGGVYYSYEDRRIDILLDVSGPYIDVNTGLVGTPRLIMPTQSRMKTQSASVFGQGTWDITPTLTAELGIRYTSDAKDFWYYQSPNANAAAAIPIQFRQALGILTVGPLTDSDSWGQATGLASLSWKPTENLNLYVRWAQGYKSGGYQSVTASGRCVNSSGAPVGCGVAGAVVGPDFNPEIPFLPETLDSWEAGIKSQLFDNRLRLNFAAFYMDYKDIQVQVTEPASSGINRKFTTNGGQARSRGVEFEAVLVPFRGMTVNGGLGFQHAEFVADRLSPTGVNQTNFKGRRLNNAPRATANLTAAYRFDVAEGWEMLTSATGYYRSKIFLNQANTIVSPAMTTLALRIGVERAGGAWGVYLWGDNLTNVRRITNSAGAKPGASAGSFFINQPRTYGVELKAKF